MLNLFANLLPHLHLASDQTKEPILAKLTAANNGREHQGADLRLALDEHLSAITASLPLDEHPESIDSIRLAVERLERSVRRLRHARVGAVAFLMLGAAVAGAGAVVGYFWKHIAPRSRFGSRLNISRHAGSNSAWGTAVTMPWF